MTYEPRHRAGDSAVDDAADESIRHGHDPRPDMRRVAIAAAVALLVVVLLVWLIAAVA